MVYMLRFLGTLVLVSVILAAASILWPVFSPRPRPEGLTRVHDLVTASSVGKTVDETAGKFLPQAGGLSAGSVAGVAVSRIVESVGDSAKEAAVKSAVDQLLTQWDSVPAAQKEQIRTAVCR
jgi:hypothetical protein